MHGESLHIFGQSLPFGAPTKLGAWGGDREYLLPLWMLNNLLAAHEDKMNMEIVVSHG